MMSSKSISIAQRTPMPLLRAVLAAATLIAALAPSSARAQALLQRLDAAPVEIDGESLEYPFLGGLHRPKAHFLDLDADGDLDLVLVRQPPDDRVTFLRNDGDRSEARFTLAEDAMAGVFIREWINLADIDGDGDLDLLTPGDEQVEWYENVGTPSKARFVKKPPQPGLAVLGGIPPAEYPRFHDLDGDGDLDYLYLRATTGLGAFHENIGTSAEPDFIDFVLGWGGFDTFVGGVRLPEEDALHGTSSLTIADVDNDSLPDLLIGDLKNKSLWYFRNDTPEGGEAHYSEVSRSLLPDSTVGRNFSALVDIDDDGVRELFINPEDRRGTKVFHYYERENDTTLAFTLSDTDYLHGIDGGLYSRPALADLDGDGDLDMVIGTGEESQVDARIEYFENTGTPASPAFRLVPPAESPFTWIEETFATRGTLTFSFGDLDHDGDLDMMMGSFDALYRFVNTGTASSPVFALCGDGCPSPDPPADEFLAPALGDVDGDGDLDLLVGEWGLSYIPNLFYYRNDGDESEFQPVLISDNDSSDVIDLGFDGFDAEDRQLVPALYDADGDGYAELMLGYRRGLLLECENRHGDDGPLFAITDRSWGGIDVGNGAAPAPGDLDGDGDWDFIVGEEGGGVNFLSLLHDDFSLERNGDGAVVLDWVSGGGEGVTGFDLYRKTGGDEEYRKIGASPIPRAGGARQAFVDSTAEPDMEYRYRLASILPDTTVLDTTSLLATVARFEFLGMTVTTDSFSAAAEWSIAARRSDVTYVLARHGEAGSDTIDHATADGVDFIAVDDSARPGNTYRYVLTGEIPDSGAVLLAADTIFVPLPVLRIGGFAADAAEGGVKVVWTLARAVPGVTFDLYRGDAASKGGAIGSARLNDEPIGGGTSFSFFDDGGAVAEAERYRLEPFYMAGTVRTPYPEEKVVSAETVSNPIVFSLLPVRPHPLRFLADKEMRISFDLPIAGAVSVRIYSINGRLVRDLGEESFSAGPERDLFWDGLDRNGEDLPAGFYFIRAESPAGKETRKILLLR